MAEILIVDEALSVGDVFFQNKCYRKFEEFKKYQASNWTENHVIQDVTISNLALMAFTV